MKIYFFSDDPEKGGKLEKTFSGARPKIKALGFLIDRKKYPNGAFYRKSVEGAWEKIR